MKYSLTIGGLVLAIALPLLGAVGFSEQCSNELVQFGLSLPGIIVAYLARVRAGGVNVLGFKK